MLETQGGSKLVNLLNGVKVLDLDKNVTAVRKKEIQPITEKANSVSVINSKLDAIEGVISIGTWVGTVVNMLPLKRNRRYKLTLSANHPWNFPVVNLYRGNTPGIKRYKGINVTPTQRVIEWDTDNEDTYAAFYKYLPASSGYDFDNSAFELEEITSNVTLHDSQGVLPIRIPQYIEEKNGREEVVIPPANIVVNGYVKQEFTDGAQAGLHSLEDPKFNASVAKKIPVTEGCWYEVDMGVDMKGTFFLFGYADADTTINSSASFWCPISRKATFYIEKGIKSISFMTSMTYPVMGVDFDARDTLKVFKIAKEKRGFDTDYGFLDLKSIAGVVDKSDEDIIDIPLDVSSYGIIRTWGTQKGITGSLRAKKRIEILIGNVYVEGYTEEGWQGNSTLLLLFKNLKDKLYKRDGVTKMNISLGGTPARNKFHRKAWYTDVTASNSLVANECWQRVFDYKPDDSRYIWNKPYSDVETDFEKRFENGACMHVVGTHIAQYDNGAFIGLRTFQTNTEREDFKMDKKNLLHNCYKHSDQRDIVTDSGRVNWEELNSDTEASEIPAERFKILTDWQAKIQSLSATNGDFKAQAETYINVQNFIDYYIICYWIGAFDSWGNNILLCTHNGIRMDIVLRDIDFSAGATPPFVIQPNQEFVANLPGFGWSWITPTSTIWAKLTASFMPEIKARYIELRDAGVWNEEVFINAFRKKEKQIGYSLLKQNADTWRFIMTNRPPTSAPNEGWMPKGGSYDSFKRKYWWYEERRKFMDAKFGV